MALILEDLVTRYLFQVQAYLKIKLITLMSFGTKKCTVYLYPKVFETAEMLQNPYHLKGYCFVVYF